MKLKNVLHNYVAYLLLAFVLIVQTVSKLYKLTFQNIFSDEYFIALTTTIASTMFIYIIFAPIGNAKEAERNISYNANLAKWSELSAKIRAGLTAIFSDFCKKREKEEIEELRREVIEGQTMLPYSEYVEKYRSLSAAELRGLFRSGTISKEVYDAIKKANAIKSVKPINPLLILCGVEHYRLNDAGRDAPNGLIRWMSRRPVIMVLSNILLNSIRPIYEGFQSAEAIYAMLLSAISTAVAAYVGYSVGVAQIKEKNEVVKNRIFFIETFEEAQKKPGG